MTLRIGDRVQMTAKGERRAKRHGLLPAVGEVLDRYVGNQVYVRRDMGCEWWPEACWEREDAEAGR